MISYVFEVGYYLKVFKIENDEVVEKKNIETEGLNLSNPQLLYLHNGDNIDAKVSEVLKSYNGSAEAKEQLRKLIYLMLGVVENETKTVE